MMRDKTQREPTESRFLSTLHRHDQVRLNADPYYVLVFSIKRIAFSSRLKAKLINHHLSRMSHFKEEPMAPAIVKQASAYIFLVLRT